MFGKVQKNIQDEKTRFYPRSAYGISKVAGFELTRNYREAYNIFACTGILFNHESPRRGFEFVTRKISKAVGRISLNLQEKLTLGNLDAVRDWGFAGDYVDAMWKMTQHEEPSDWVIATGKTQTVQDFAKLAFEEVNLKWEDYVETSEKYFRPNEVEHLLGDPSKARDKLN